MSMMDLINKKNDEDNSGEDAGQEPDTAPEPEPEKDGDPLADAKADYEADRQEFDLRDYDLDHEQKRKFVQWRKDLLKEATETQKESDIPPVNPPDAAPDEAPLDLADQVIGDFDFTDVSGVGEKTAENIRQKIANDGIEDLIELVDYDLTKISGIGAKGAASLEEAIKAEKNWTPEGEDADQDQLLEAAKQAGRAGDWPQAKTFEGQMPEDTAQAFAEWRSDYIQGDGDDPEQENTADDAGDQGGDPTVQDKKPPASGRDSGDFPVTQALAGDSEPSILFIDCLPTKGTDARSLADLLEPAKATVAEEQGTRYWNADRYSNGRKLLVDVVLEDPSILEGCVYANSSVEGAEQLLPEIRQFFDIVIEG